MKTTSVQLELPLYAIAPKDPELLLNIYGVVNGIFLACAMLLLFTSLSYYKQKHLKTIRGYTAFSSYMMLSISFMGFALYNVYYQGFSGAVTTTILPAWLFELSVYGSPIALACSTRVFLLITEAKLYQAYEVQQRYWWVINGLFLLDLFVFITLLFVEDSRIRTLLNSSIFVPHAVAGTLYSFRTLHSIPYSKWLAILFLGTAAVFIVYNWQLLTYTLSFTPEFIALTHCLFCFAQIIFTFIALRYGSDEIERITKIRRGESQYLMHSFPAALTNDQFFLTYQPQIDLETDEIHGVEVLVRWLHPKFGIISPDEFIELAEDLDKIDSICKWVISHACHEISELQAKNGYHCRFSINFSAKNLNLKILDCLLTNLDKYSIPPKMVTVEITETIMLAENKESSAFFEGLKEHGIDISLDDYGTGFSSLSYLTKLNIKELKIDRSFIHDILQNSNHQAIASSTIAMSKSMQNRVVAEGVEDKETLELLKRIECDLVQGYYIAKPMRLNEFSVWLERSGYRMSLI